MASLLQVNMCNSVNYWRVFVYNGGKCDGKLTAFAWGANSFATMKVIGNEEGEEAEGEG